MARISFNPEQVRPFSGAATVLPGGISAVEIVGESERDLPNGNRMLTFDVQVLEGACKGAILHENFHLWNTNPKAVEVAQSKLVSIMLAVGMKTFMETRELHRKPFSVRLSVVQYDGKDRNQFDEFMPPRQSAPQYAQPAPQYAPQPASQYAQPSAQQYAPQSAPQQSEPGWF